MRPRRRRHVLCLRSIASAVLALGSPAADLVDHAVDQGADGSTPKPAELATDAVAPSPPASEAGSAAWLPARGLAPLSAPVLRQSPARSPGAVSAPSPPTTLPADGAAPLASADPRSAPLDRVVAPLGHVPTRTDERVAPRRIEVVRIEVLVGPVWRIRTTEVMALASAEFGRQRGFSGTVQGGVIVAPDRNVVGVADFPIGAGFVYRHRFGQRSVSGSVGVTAGLLVHRAGTERGVIHRVDPDLQLPLRFAWTVGKIGFSFALLQGLSTRARTYARRGVEVWHRIPYRIGFAVGIHFDVGVGKTRSRRSNRETKAPP